MNEQRIIIIEDEHLPARQLEKLISEARPSARIMAVLQTIDESVEWFNTNEMPDIAFMDIHLADGLSFSIFEEIQVKCPVIFTTAYDQYALKAFEVNSIDYLLKPIRKEDLDRALNKLDALSGGGKTTVDAELISRIVQSLPQNTPSYKQSFFVTSRDTLVPVQIKDIAFFYFEDRMVQAFGYDGRSYIMDVHSLEQLSHELDPSQFFRVNRQFIISRSAIKNIATWFGSRVVVNLTVPSERIVISRTNVSEFKKWVTG